MGIGTLGRALRAGLVGILLAFACTTAFSQDLDIPGDSEAVPSGQQEVDLSLKDYAEIGRSECKEHYSNLLNLLFLLPGMLFFVVAVITRRTGKLFFIFALLLLLGSTGSEHSTLIQEAEQSFASGDYGRAMEIYRQVEKQLPCNSAVLYNLGVVSSYLVQPGYAIHYLRRSLRLAPADRQARSALLNLERRYGLAGQVAPPFPVDPDLAYLLMLVFTNAVFVMGALVFRTKKVQFLISLVLVAIAALGCLAFFLGRLYLESRSVGVVVSDEGELFRVPEQDSRSWFDLPAGTSLWIRGRTGKYYLVETPAQIDGWVRRDTILID
jgi:tetratricopeptide (TPR) repeat protein